MIRTISALCLQTRWGQWTAFLARDHTNTISSPPILCSPATFFLSVLEPRSHDYKREPKYLHAQFSGRNNHNRLDSCSCWHNLGKHGKKICQCLSRACLLSHPILTSGRSQLDTFITDREITKMGIKPRLVFPVSILHSARN